MVNGVYVMMHMPDHPRANKLGYVSEHVAVAFKKYGHAAPDGQIVHHINMLKEDNSPDNLVYVEKPKHHLLHRQMERLVPELMRRGIIEFDAERGYHFAGETANPLEWDIRRNCEQCGHQFAVKTKRPRQRFCGVPCMRAHNRGDVPVV